MVHTDLSDATVPVERVEGATPAPEDAAGLHTAEGGAKVAEDGAKVAEDDVGEQEVYTLKYLGEEIAVTRDELIRLAQKGRDYDRIRSRAEKLAAQLKELTGGAAAGTANWEVPKGEAEVKAATRKGREVASRDEIPAREESVADGMRMQGASGVDWGRSLSSGEVAAARAVPIGDEALRKAVFGDEAKVRAAYSRDIKMQAASDSREAKGGKTAPRGEAAIVDASDAGEQPLGGEGKLPQAGARERGFPEGAGSVNPDDILPKERRSENFADTLWRERESENAAGAHRWERESENPADALPERERESSAEASGQGPGSENPDALRREREIEDFLRVYGPVKAEAIPEAVWREVSRGVSLLTAYQVYENRLLRAALAAERLARSNATRAVGSGATAGGFLRGDLIEDDWYKRD
ncbi:MAG TPA: hypothetical protein GXZ77_01850 [Papillibacter sp.]|nr:hypothetical protein [Papillibacter sp.]